MNTEKRILRAVSVIMLLPLILFSLGSCSLKNSFLSFLGYDIYDYEGEPVTGTVDPESDEVAELKEMIKMLSVRSPEIPEFSSEKEALDKCRDSLLNYLLSTGFSMYMGNTELLEEAKKEYPHMQLISVISASDFENFVYTYFGGSTRIKHESTELFVYLDKTEAYTAVSASMENNIDVNVISCEKTERTYRLTFRNELNGKVSPVYRALIIHRADGSNYFKSVKKVQD